MHESRNVDTSEKNAPSKIKIEYSFFDHRKRKLYNDEKCKNMKYCVKYDSMK